MTQWPTPLKKLRQRFPDSDIVQMRISSPKGTSISFDGVAGSAVKAALAETISLGRSHPDRLRDWREELRSKTTGLRDAHGRTDAVSEHAFTTSLRISLRQMREESARAGDEMRGFVFGLIYDALGWTQPLPKNAATTLSTATKDATENGTFDRDALMAVRRILERGGFELVPQARVAIDPLGRDKRGKCVRDSFVEASDALDIDHPETPEWAALPEHVREMYRRIGDAIADPPHGTAHECNVCGATEESASFGPYVCPWCVAGMMQPTEDL